MSVTAIFHQTLTFSFGNGTLKVGRAGWLAIAFATIPTRSQVNAVERRIPSVGYRTVTMLTPTILTARVHASPSTQNRRPHTRTLCEDNCCRWCWSRTGARRAIATSASNDWAHEEGCHNLVGREEGFVGA